MPDVVLAVRVLLTVLVVVIGMLALVIAVAGHAGVSSCLPVLP
jgi:hypothetical protein